MTKSVIETGNYNEISPFSDVGQSASATWVTTAVGQYVGKYQFSQPCVNYSSLTSKSYVSFLLVLFHRFRLLLGFSENSLRKLVE